MKLSRCHLHQALMYKSRFSCPVIYVLQSYILLNFLSMQWLGNKLHFVKKTLFLIVFSIFVPCFQSIEDSVSSVAIHHGLDDMVAIGYTSGSVYIFQLPSKEMGHSKKVFILLFYVLSRFEGFFNLSAYSYFSTVAL